MGKTFSISNDTHTELDLLNRIYVIWPQVPQKLSSLKSLEIFKKNTTSVTPETIRNDFLIKFLVTKL